MFRVTCPELRKRGRI